MSDITCPHCARLRAAIAEAQDTLTQMPCGGIGTEGATQEELDAASAEGKAYADDASYHDAQQAWLTLEKALKEEA